MITAPLPLDEDIRLRALHRLDILDSEPEEAFDRIARLAARAFRVPIVLVSLVDEDRQWFKSHHGIAACETPRSMSFCAHAVLSKRLLVVEDALDDERFLDNPLVLGAPHIRFYAGAPLRLADGEVVGTLCLIDTVPRAFEAEDVQTLIDYAQLVERELDVRRRLIRSRTAHERDRRSLAISEARFTTVFRETPIGNALVALDGRFLDVNPTFSEIIGYDEATLRKLTFAEVTHPADVAADLALVSELLAGKQSTYTIEKRYMRPDGKAIWVNLAVTLLRDAAGVPAHFIAAVQDIDSRKRSEEALRNYHAELEERVRERTGELRRSRDALQTITDNLPVMIAVVDRDLRYRFYNDTFKRVLGPRAPGEVGANVAETLRPEVFAQLQPHFTRALAGERVTCDEVQYREDEDRVWCTTYIPAKRDGRVTGFYVMAHDVTEQRRTEQRLRESALVDALTGLANRRALEEELAAARLGACRFAVFFVDLDGLKGINDRFGHDAGDALLREAARRLAATVRAGDFVSRLGGDEFVVVSRGVADAQAAGRIAQSICHALARPFVTGGMRVEASASVGVAIREPAGAGSALGALGDDLLAVADSAMYEAKRAGRNTWRLGGAWVQGADAADGTLAALPVVSA
ncbi:PAS domain S-box-containing protein/diguanylate cyclase (GGDEF)-like protein [Paraburkholderia tropica]|uniref:PAS domain S-box protein n=1 Tax=Paraburkholderia tropica TaxID=92647 RepID=UPI001CB5EDC6|nr:PAS domain S-box protein [Paraburkholderia tropica]CAG9214401.1 PAS domain S-box-containing protein/diguanylate cyclase (GGDEF)-like protein [Paraburkholderia tropica]